MTENALFAMKGSERETDGRDRLEREKERAPRTRVYSPNTAVTSATTRDIGSLDDRMTSVPPSSSWSWPWSRGAVTAKPSDRTEHFAGRSVPSARANRETVENCPLRE